MEIHPLVESDVKDALKLSTQAGWNQVEADWRRLLTLWPNTCLGGRLEGRLIATATLAVYGDVGWVGMMLVDEAHRGRGYGGAMLDAVLAAGIDAGARAFGLDATELGRPLYLKRGFRDVGWIDRWSTPSDAAAREPTESVPTRAGIWWPRAGEWEALLTADSLAVGPGRGELLKHLATEVPLRVAVERSGSDTQVKAFAALRPGRVADHVGPVVAETEWHAEVVLDRLLRDAVRTGRALVMDVPRGQLTAWLHARGWRVARQLWRMHTDPDPRRALLGRHVFAAAGFELG